MYINPLGDIFQNGDFPTQFPTTVTPIGTITTTCTGGWHCPHCGEHFHPIQQCTCKGPWAIYIPPGQHIHVYCPVHGDVKIYGPSVTY